MKHSRPWECNSFFVPTHIDDIAYHRQLAGLPVRITSRLISINDLDVHILEAFPPTAETPTKPPLLVLLHGFPEIAYSWRKIMEPLANSGFDVVAPDQRGFGQTRERGEPHRRIAYEDDLAPFRILTWSQTSSHSSTRWGTRRSPPLLGTISARASRRIARSSARISSRRSCS